MLVQSQIIKYLIILFIEIISQLFSHIQILFALTTLQGIVSYDKDGLFLDNERFVMRAGELSPYRIPVNQWDHAIKMSKAMGLNTISFYIVWNQHLLQNGSFDFSSEQLNISHWLELIQDNGMKALVRPGPYICAEIDNGGIPSYLNKYNIRRIWDQEYRNGVNQYLTAVGQQINQWTYENGGCIIMIQLENEYGYWPFKDQNYILYLKNWFIRNGFPQQTFYIADPSQYLDQYTIPDGVNIGLDGSDAEKNFKKCRRFLENRHNENNFCFVSEIYQSWYTAFNQSQASQTDISKYLEGYLKNNISFSIYMIYGGYNYGMLAGANKDILSNYLPMATSYYDTASIESSGLPTDSFYQNREIIGRYYPEILNIQVPENITFGNVKNIEVQKVADIESQQLDQIMESQEQFPSFEDMNKPLGMAIYSFDIQFNKNGNMTFNDIHDYAQIYMDNELIKTFSYTNESSYKLEFSEVKGKQQHHFDVILDTMGHINFGGEMWLEPNKKGLLNVYFEHTKFFIEKEKTYPTNMKWRHIPITNQLDQMNINKSINSQSLSPAAIYQGKFDMDVFGNTFIHMDNWKRGYVFVNGHNLGRYWTYVGPDTYVFCPDYWLKQTDNEITVIDLEQTEVQSIYACENKYLCEWNDNNNDDNNNNNSSSNLSTGAIVGIVIASIVFVVLIIAVIILAIKYRSSQNLEQQFSKQPSKYN